MAHDNNTHNTAGMAGIAIASAAVGAMVAMLLTPKSGHEIREKIAEKAHTAKDKAEEMSPMDNQSNTP